MFPHLATTQTNQNHLFKKNQKMTISTPTKQARTSTKNSPSSSKKDPLQVAVITNTVLEFLPGDGYLYFAPVNTMFEQVWLDSKRKKETMPVFEDMTINQLIECHETGLSTIPFDTVANKMARVERKDLLEKEVEIRGHPPLPLSALASSAGAGNLEVTKLIYNSNSLLTQGSFADQSHIHTHPHETFGGVS